MAQHYRNEIIAQARSLALEGYSLRKAETELTRRFPGERVPTHPTLMDWRKTDNESLHEELEGNELRISRRADELIDAKMDSLTDNIDKVRLPELVMAAGVFRDKTFKRQELRKGSPGFDHLLALVQKVEHELLPDGSKKSTNTRAIILSEGEMP